MALLRSCNLALAFLLANSGLRTPVCGQYRPNGRAREGKLYLRERGQGFLGFSRDLNYDCKYVTFFCPYFSLNIVFNVVGISV